MKNISTLLIFLLLMFSCGKKEVKKENEEYKEPEIEIPVSKVDKIDAPKIQEQVSEIVFTVQIAALENENEDLLSIDGIQTYQENGLTKYRLGAFKTYKGAREFRTQILEDYNDAFVQALLNEQPISILKAL